VYGQPDVAPGLPGTRRGTELASSLLPAGDQRASGELVPQVPEPCPMQSAPYYLVGADREDIIRRHDRPVRGHQDYDSTRQASFRSFAEL
jgi:hypothetical protein